MAHETQLIPDSTIWIQLGIFILTYFTLKYLVFDPYLKLLKLRNEKTKGLLEESAKKRAEAEISKSEYESYMREERKKLSLWLEEERKKISDNERQLLGKVREGVSKDMQVLKDNLAAQVKDVKKELSPSVKEFAEAISSKILGHKVKITSSAKETSSKESRAHT